jgi:hypothetical protein
MLFVQTNDHDREQRQIDASARIEARGVGKAAFDVAGGWNAQPGASFNEKMFAKDCAEWASGRGTKARTCSSPWPVVTRRPIRDDGEVGIISLTLAISLCKRTLESLH